MGENTPYRPGRLIGALIVVTASTALLAGCAGREGIGADPVDTPSTASVTSAPAPDPTTSAPAPEETVPASAATETATTASVAPFITSATASGDGIDVGAVVPDVVESDGTCTATATRNGVTVTKAGPAAAAASYTGCPQLLLSGSDLVAGTWSVTVSYASAESIGTSKPRTVTVG